MLGNLINLIYRGLSIKRWNNYPRIEEFVETEHISLKLNLAYITSQFLRERGEEIDLIYMYQKIFWDSFFTFIYSDIKFDVKNYLKNNYIKTYIKLWEQIYNFINFLDIHPLLKQDLDNFYSKFIDRSLFEKGKEKEKKLLKFIKIIEIKQEIKNNIRFYPEIYNNIYEEIDKKLNNISKEINLSKEIPIIEKYLNILLKLKFSYRWNRMNKTYPVSVLSHLYLVFSFSYFLGILKQLKTKEFENLLNISLLHDLPEAFTGDIITPTKKAIPNFENIIEEIESKITKKHISLIFGKYKFKNKLELIALKPFTGKIGKIAKFSDNLSAMFECKIEESSNFLTIYYNIKRYLWNKNDKELDYILKYGIDFFQENTEVKWKKFIGLSE